MFLKEAIIILHGSGREQYQVVGCAGYEMELEHVWMTDDAVNEGFHPAPILPLQADLHED